MNLRDKTLRIIEILKAEFPNSKCALNYRNNFELLVATILSAQCTDKRVNMVTEKLFERYRTPYDFANADIFELEKLIHSTGFYRNKAKNILAMAKIVLEKFGGEVPAKMDDLLSLPGVARKTANVVLGVGFGINEGVVVDTHVKRISQRLGLSKEANPNLIEKDLMQVVPEDFRSAFSLLMIDHGRKTCNARKPLCESCGIRSYCDYFRKLKS
jgi:endonuclease-3